MKQLDMTQQQSRLRRMIRSGIAFLVAGSTLLIGGSLVASFVQSDSRQQRADLQIGLFAEKKLQEFRENNVRYIFLGDSLSMPNAGGGETPQLRVANQIRSNEGGNNFRDLSLPGMTIFSHYFLNAQIADVGAEKVIIGFNMNWFSRPAHHQPLGLEGFLPVDQWFAAMQLPLGPLGVTAADIVSAGIVDQLGLRPARQHLQELQGDFYLAYRQFVRNFQKLAGAPRGMAGARGSRQLRLLHTPPGTRLERVSVREMAGPVLAGLTENEPGLQVLEELILRLRRGGTEVLVLAQPMNVAYLREVGVVDEAALEESIRQLRNAAESNGADFLDLHDALPNEAFRDHRDHLNFHHSSDPPELLARPMLEWLEGSGQDHRPLPRSRLSP